MGASLAAQAGNILVNPGFEADGNHGSGVPITGWNGAQSGNWYINTDFEAHSGNNYYKVWGQYNGSPNYTATYQDNDSAPGSSYTADAWMYTSTNNAQGNSDILWSGDDADYAWLEVSFRDSGNNILALYKSDLFSDTLGSVPYAPGVWYDFKITNICQTTPPYSVIGHTNTLWAPPGTVKVRFQHTLYQLLNGGGSGYMDDANLNQTGGPVPPQITQLYPGTLLFATNRISFHVVSASSTPISTSNIHLVVNGIDVSSSCTFSGASPDITVTYAGIAAGAWGYTASITVADAYNFTASASMSFDTVTPAFVWEAEDYDFTNGMYYSNPILSSTEQANSYYGVTGVVGTDFSGNGTNGPNLYRTNDHAGIGVAGETARQNFLTAQLTDPGVQDYAVGYIGTGNWMNYTRNYPAGTYNIYARLAGGSGATVVALSNLTSGTLVGNFEFNGTDWGAYNYVPLVDGNGNLLPFTFDGSKQTLKVMLVSGGDNMNFFMLVAAQVGLPFLSNITPTNGQVFATDTAFSFTADSSVGLNASGIHLMLNGADVTGSLQISGSANTKTVSCPLLASNMVYTAVIAVTNTAGIGVARTVQFDTMRTDNFYLKVEDFDYSGGQWDTVNNGMNAPLAYYGNTLAISNVDYLHNRDGAFPFRDPGLATELTSDVALPGYLANGDWDVGYFNQGDWGNYTRKYPAGKYLVYGRLAGGSGPLTAYLDKVTGGLGTQNQTTLRLGTWRANTGGWQIWAWVPLTDSGLVAPVIVTLGGTNTLRVTSGGNVNANYFMLVPAQGIKISAAKSGSNILVSFPTAPASNYRVFYSSSLSGSWSLLTTVAGDGTVKSVSDPATASVRFYKVSAP